MSATEARPMFRPPIVVCSALPGDFETVPEARAAWEAAGQPGALNDPRGMVWAARYVVAALLAGLGAAAGPSGR